MKAEENGVEQVALDDRSSAFANASFYANRTSVESKELGPRNRIKSA
jgi:hypothetical protein